MKLNQTQAFIQEGTRVFFLNMNLPGDRLPAPLCKCSARIWGKEPRGSRRKRIKWI